MSKGALHGVENGWDGMSEGCINCVVLASIERLDGICISHGKSRQSAWIGR